MLDPHHLPKKDIPKCFISIEKRVVLKLLVVKKLNDTATVGFSHFILEQTARHRCFTNIPVNSTPAFTPITIQSSPNHNLIDTFITSTCHVLLLKQLSTLRS